MAQNINLLEEITLTQVAVLNSRLLLQVVGVWMGMLIAVYIFSAIGYHSDKKKLSLIEEQVGTLTAKIQDEKTRLSSLSGLEVTSEVNSKNLIESKGFYGDFEDLAKAVPPGVWLTDIVISRLDGSVTLKGHTVIAAGIPALILALNKSNNLRDKKFDVLKIEKNSETQYIDFTIATDLINQDTG